MTWSKDDFPRYTSSSVNVNVTGPGTWFIHSSSASATVTLPPKSSIPSTDYPVYKIVATSGAAPVIITRASSDTINLGGSTSVTNFTIGPGESVEMIHNGLNWVPVSGSQTPAVYRKFKVVSGTTQTLDRSASMWSFTGSAASTWTLPALNLNTGLEYIIKNKGSADITLQRAGADNLYTTAAVTSITITAGGSARIINDGAHWAVV